MAKWGWRIIFDDENENFDYTDSNEGPYDTEEEAAEMGAYAQSCMRTGAEMFHLSNPGDYPMNGDEIDTGEMETFEVE